MKMLHDSAADAPRTLELANGTIVDPANIDELVTAFEFNEEALEQARRSKEQIALTLEQLTTGDARTRRVEGKERRAKLEMPPDSWDSRALFTAWEKHPEHRDRVLRIERVAVRKREFTKLLETTTTDPSLAAIRDDVAKANRGPRGTPRVTVER